MSGEREFQPNDSVAWQTYNSRGLGWGVVESVGEDGTLTIRSGPYRQKVTKHADDIERHESGPSRFYSMYPRTETGSRKKARR